jgi:hypothetical protein
VTSNSAPLVDGETRRWKLRQSGSAPVRCERRRIGFHGPTAVGAMDLKFAVEWILGANAPLLIFW